MKEHYNLIAVVRREERAGEFDIRAIRDRSCRVAGGGCSGEQERRRADRDQSLDTRKWRARVTERYNRKIVFYR